MLRPYHPCQIEITPILPVFFHWHITTLLNCRIDSLAYWHIGILAYCLIAELSHCRISTLPHCEIVSFPSPIIIAVSPFFRTFTNQLLGGLFLLHTTGAP